MSRRIDHLVVAVRDLDKAASFYRSLGFQVGARNRHPWGTENHVVQVPGGFIELITVGDASGIAPHGPDTFSFGAFVQDYLRHREGLAMLVLDSRDAKADASEFARKGIGAFEPFFFERKAKRPDGSETQVSFTLAFARNEAAPRAGFFVCQQHFPENFWNPAFQTHDNGADRLSSVALAAPEPERHKDYLTAFTGVAPGEPEAHDFTFPLNEGHLDVMTPDDAAEIFGSVEAELDQPAFVAFSVRLRDLPAQAHRLDAAGIPYQHIGSRLIVPASVAFGVAIGFEAA
ncbi:VOC family protein [Microvirga pudoricolor]|uniref:VOC family protein n=1 Tax=Microvirga pudoricolor TaxID=2778729 RepID=UPI001951539C|nr:VOC family protein [Microvirga pudoricolor]MBM6595743.1 VOC family protein [Microvirga pudoricolor]